MPERLNPIGAPGPRASSASAASHLPEVGPAVCVSRQGRAGVTEILTLVIFLFAAKLSAASLSNPAVDSYNVRVGTQTFAGLYQFTTNTLLVETAQAIRDLGSGVIKFYLGTDVQRQSHITLTPNLTNLLTLVRDEPSYHRVLDMPFQHFVLWAYPFGNAWPFDGYSSTERADDYQEMFDLTSYLLTNYDNSGKTFYLGHWEGDWYLLPNYNTSTNPTPTAIQGMIDWLNNRQKGVDDAKAAIPHSNVNVLNYAEVNRVLDATSGDTNINQRAINTVIPYVTNLDCLSYSSYDVMAAGASTLWSTLDYMESMLPTNKASVVPGQRLWIGEYGWGTLDNTTQEQNSRAYLQRLLTWNPGPRFILFWEMYNNETNCAYWLIDSNNVKVASYYLHNRFLNNARLLTAQFQERNGRLPIDSEFEGLVTPMLNQPLPPPVNLAVGNRAATLLNAGTASVSGTLAQGVYGDDCASVQVFYGRQDGGASRGAWEQSQFIALNTNFNLATFTAALANLAPNTNYFFRFYATNSSGEAWAPASAQFSTTALNPADYGSRMKITFTGYNRGEALLDFPVLVNLSTNLPGFSYRQFASATGGDLRFADAGGLLPLPFEIDEWDTYGVSTVWVRLSQLATTNDFIWAYWGNPLAPASPASSTNGSVWSADHFLVYHLKQSGFPYADSSQQHPALSGAAPGSTSGIIGHACLFDGSFKYLNSGAINLGNAFTLSAWVNLAPAATNIQTIWANKAGGYNTAGFALYVDTYLTSDHKVFFETGNGTLGAAVSTAAGAVSSGQWHLITAAIDRAGGTGNLYVDGANPTQASAVLTDFANQNTLNLGRFTNADFYWTGMLDEARIESVLRSPNWIWASWMTAAANSAFASYSGITQAPSSLSLTSKSSSQLLSWPASGVGLALYSATNLAPPILWTPVTNHSQWQVSLPSDPNANRFYRLQPQP